MTRGQKWAQVATNLRFFWDNTTWPKGYDVGLSYLFHTEMREALKIAYGSMALDNFEQHNPPVLQ